MYDGFWRFFTDGLWENIYYFEWIQFLVYDGLPSLDFFLIKSRRISEGWSCLQELKPVNKIVYCNQIDNGHHILSTLQYSLVMHNSQIHLMKTMMTAYVAL